MILSIIVPVYNVENYLEKCIESLFRQDLSYDKYEIIAVNDGSTDGSLQVLETLQETYPSIKTISQKNKGLSGARNTGFDNAKGEYILCVDSDDYILDNTLKLITNVALKNSLDILEFGASGVTDSKKVIYSCNVSTQGHVLSGEQYLHDVSYMNSACNKLYNRNFLNSNNLRFMEGVYIEDIEFNTRAVFKAHKIMAIDTTIAHFLQRDGSITRTKNIEKTKKMIFDIYTVLSSINDFTETKITKTSIAYIPMKKRVSSLITTMLLRVLTGINDYNIKIEIFKNLKNKDLYPIRYKLRDKPKNYFRIFANNNFLFSVVCKLYCLKNK